MGLEGDGAGGGVELVVLVGAAEDGLELGDEGLGIGGVAGRDLGAQRRDPVRYVNICQQAAALLARGRGRVAGGDGGPGGAGIEGVGAAEILLPGGEAFAAAAWGAAGCGREGCGGAWGVWGGRGICHGGGLSLPPVLTQKGSRIIILLC